MINLSLRYESIDVYAVDCVFTVQKKTSFGLRLSLMRRTNQLFAKKKKKQTLLDYFMLFSWVPVLYMPEKRKLTLFLDSHKQVFSIKPSSMILLMVFGRSARRNWKKNILCESTLIDLYSTPHILSDIWERAAQNNSAQQQQSTSCVWARKIIFSPRNCSTL